MTPQQKKRFKKICKDMENIINELHAGDHPFATMFLEDGSPAFYDWPGDIESRPDIQLCDGGAYWHRAGGGGR